MAFDGRAALLVAIGAIFAARVVQLTIFEDFEKLLRESCGVFVLGGLQ